MLVHKPLERFGKLKRVKILTLDIFNKAYFIKPTLGKNSIDMSFLKHLMSAVPAFSSGEYVGIWRIVALENNRHELTVFLDRPSEFLKTLFVERLAGLIRIGPYLGEFD